MLENGVEMIDERLVSVGAGKSDEDAETREEKVKWEAKHTNKLDIKGKRVKTGDWGKIKGLMHEASLRKLLGSEVKENKTN